MSKEQYRSATEIDAGMDMSYMYDDIERIRERESEEEKTQQSKLSLAGLMAILAGVGMGLVAFGEGIISNDMSEFLLPLLGIVGFASLGYGLYKTVKLAFRRKELEFPTLMYIVSASPRHQRKWQRKLNSRQVSEQVDALHAVNAGENVLKSEVRIRRFLDPKNSAGQGAAECLRALLEVSRSTRVFRHG